MSRHGSSRAREDAAPDSLDLVQVEEPGLRRKPERTFLGRSLSEIEARAARSVPLDVLDLPHWLEVKCRVARHKTLLDLATASRLAIMRRSREHPLAVSRFVLKLDNFIAGSPFAERIGSDGIEGLPGEVRRLLAIIGHRYRDILEGTAGLWDGRRIPLRTLGARRRVSATWIEHLRDCAHSVLKQELDGARFRDCLRSLCGELLTARQGLARVEEWRDPGSELCRGQEEAYLAFRFLCRVCRVEPQALSIMTDDGLCCDRPATAERLGAAIKEAVKVLRRAGRAVHFEELRRQVASEENDPEGAFLWRALTLSREVQIVSDRVVRLRRKRQPRPSRRGDSDTVAAPAASDNGEDVAPEIPERPN